MELGRWEARLARSDWFTGDRVGFLDYAVFGHLQCMTSGLTDPLLAVLRAQPRLMAWLERFIALHSEHEPLYVRRLFGAAARRREASFAERGAFWLAWAGWLAVLPFTVCVICTALFRRTRNPAHSGAVLRRAREASTSA